MRADGEGRRFLELCDHLVDLWDINASGLEWGEDAGPSRTHRENHQAAWVGSVGSWTSKPVINVGRFTNPDTMLEAIRQRAMRRDRRRPPVDRRPVPPAEDQGGAARRDPGVHRLQRVHLALGDRRPADRLHSERDLRRGVPAGLAPGAIPEGRELRQRRPGRGRRPGGDGVRDRAREAGHAPRPSGRGRGRSGRMHEVGPAACRASASGLAWSTTGGSRSRSCATCS